MIHGSMNLVVIRSENLIKAENFYSNLGLKFVRHRHGDGPEHLMCKDNNLTFEIYPRLPDDCSTAGVRLGFKVDSIDAVLSNYTLIQYVHLKPTMSQWGRVLVLLDPDAHRIDLFEMELPPMEKVKKSVTIPGATLSDFRELVENAR